MGIYGWLIKVYEFIQEVGVNSVTKKRNLLLALMGFLERNPAYQLSNKRAC